MRLLEKILLQEIVSLYKCEVIIRTDAKKNRVDIYNEIRALENVVIAQIVQSDVLDRRSTNDYEYSLLKIKYLAQKDGKLAIKEIASDAVSKTNIPGLLQFIPRYGTVEKIMSY